jgi:leucyl/phenylalanyl-tRNA--protein transferase
VADAAHELTPELVLAAYAQGLFPMADPRDGAIGWYSPDPRGVIPLESFHVPRSLAKRVRRGDYVVTVDQAFQRVIRDCAAPRDGEDDTWIDDRIIAVYGNLHRAGLAHSVEAWASASTPRVPPARRIDIPAFAPSPPPDAVLAGGLYGVSLRGAFFGESMFARRTDASKVCLVHLVDHLKRCGFLLLDTQWSNEHLEQFGVVDVPRAVYLRRLGQALSAAVAWQNPGLPVGGGVRE